MYSDSELDAAVTAGVLTAPAAAAFRDFVAHSHAAPGVDEEHFRLLTGFNDIFVTIAAALILIATAWLAAQVAPWLGGAAVAAAAWGLAEYFTRKRRMALPSILLLLAFVAGVFATVLGVMTTHDGWRHLAQAERSLMIALALAVAGGAAWLHWRRFMVPITVAAGAFAGAATALLLLAAVFPGLEPLLRAGSFTAGLAIFALAMWWDASDRQRTTRRADVAFWLHLAAAPLIVHSTFGALGLLSVRGAPDAGAAALGILLYIVLAAVALAVDRRALLVSALAYVLYAISALLRGAGSVSFAFAAAALVIGCLLLLLSALWQRVRRSTVGLLPGAIQLYLPPV
jgi:MFS family permease